MSRGRAWTEIEDSTLLRLHAEGMGWADIGVVIGRSRQSCHSRWQLLAPEPTQTCRGCGKTKPVSAFHERTVNSRALVCKACVTVQATNASRVRHGGTPKWQPAGPGMWSVADTPSQVDYKARLLSRVKGR